MANKVCFRCKIEKDLSEFYFHPFMKDRHLNKCIDCTKSDSIRRHKSNCVNPEWMETERLRHREKYYRLGYRIKQIEWDKNKPWKQTSKYKNLNRNLRSLGVLSKGETAHHWSYMDENLQDVFLMSLNTHKKIHKYLIHVDRFFYFNNIPLSNKNIHFSAIMDILQLEGINETIRQFKI